MEFGAYCIWTFTGMKQQIEKQGDESSNNFFLTPWFCSLVSARHSLAHLTPPQWERGRQDTEPQLACASAYQGWTGKVLAGGGVECPAQEARVSYLLTST